MIPCPDKSIIEINLIKSLLNPDQLPKIVEGNSLILIKKTVIKKLFQII